MPPSSQDRPRTPPMTLRRWIARAMPWWLRAIVAIFVLRAVVGLPSAIGWWAPWGLAALAFVRAPKQDDRKPVVLEAPVRGRWAALNSPASRVPSHGVRAYGQSHAVDLLHPHPPGTRVRLGFGLGMRPPEESSSFGEPVLAMADGVVVATCDWQRDHRTRLSWPALVYLLVVEGVVRELGGPQFMLGNHVVIDHGDGTCSAYAHLRQGSVAVAPGDRVAAGQALGEVGSSGNTTEPHLHVQVMDHPVPTAAAGLPFRWRGITIDPGDRDAARHRKAIATDVIEGLPANGQVLRAPEGHMSGS